jgi:hypothetical protein
VNDCPLTVICDITTDDDPALVTETLVLALCPTGTDPNVIDCVDAVSNGFPLVVFDPTDETGAVQPERTTLQTSSTQKAAFSRSNLLGPAPKVGHIPLQKDTKVFIYDYLGSESIAF